MIESWWDDRVEKGFLVETPEGFVFDEAYIARVLEELCEEEPVTEL